MNFRGACLTALLVFSFFNAAAATYTPKQIRDDLGFLYETLQASHYDLFARVSREAYDREYQRTLESIDRPMDDLQAYRTLQPFVARAGMAHCNIALPFNTTYVPYVMKGGTVIPFDLTFAVDGAYVLHNYSGNPALAPGTRIEAIDGKPVSVVMDEVGRFVSGDSPELKRAAIELTAFPRLHWLTYGEVRTHALTVGRSDGTHAEVVAESVPAMQYEQKASAQKPRMDSSREIRFIGSVAYLRPGAFLNNQSDGDIASHATFEKGEFVQFIDAAFREIRERKPASLVIDLRNNPGGDNSFSDLLVAYFAQQGFRFCSRFEVKTSQLTKNFWKDVTDPKLAGLQQAILTRENGERFLADIPLVEPRAETERYQGRVSVLVNRFTYSNAVVVAAMFQDYKLGAVVGETTADVPTTYGAAHQFTLPNTKFTVMYPKALMIRPSGDAAFSGVRPDHEVADDPFNERDEVLEKALELAR